VVKLLHYMYAPVWLGTGLEVEGSRAQLWSVDAVPVLRDPPECLSVQWLPASNASVLVSVTAPLLSPSPEGGQATLKTRPPSALRVNQKRQRSPARSRRRVTGGTSRVRASRSPATPSGPACPGARASAWTAHSCCSSLQFARSRNGPDQTSASQCGRGTIAPTVTCGSNWPCSRSWSRG
jgi:hypothetical protein